MLERGPGGLLCISVFWHGCWMHFSHRTILSTINWMCLVCADPAVLESWLLIHTGFIIRIPLQGGVNRVANVSDLSMLSSMVVLPSFLLHTTRPSGPYGMLSPICFRTKWVLWADVASNAVFWSNWCLRTQRLLKRKKWGTVREGGKGSQENINHKIAQQCLCKHVLARWLHFWVFVSWSAPPIINRSPCFMKQFQCMWFE